MIGIVQNIITNPNLFNVASNTASQMACKIGVQSVGQPAFVLANNQLDSQTKKYSATKELLYQLLCLGINFAIVIPIFQKNAFRIAKKLYKNEPVFNMFKNVKEFKKYNELETDIEKNTFLNNIKSDYKPTADDMAFGRGITNLVSIIGSVLGFAILAPLTSKESRTSSITTAFLPAVTVSVAPLPSASSSA